DGSTLSQQAYLVGGTATGEVNVGDRRITGLSAGAAGTDAVNVAQLMEVATGSVADAVMYDSTAHNRVTLGTTGATAPVALTNVAAGALTTTSTDAVNGSQLFATNQAIDGLQTGSVLYDTNPDGSPDYSSVTLGGDSYNATTQTGGTTITNVANGVAASDAVNVSQLTALTNTGTKYFHANSTGTDSSATGQDAVAIGMGAIASADNSVALGAGSLADGSTLSHQAYLVGGTATGEVNVGERRITGLAAGADDTDAVNVAQLSTLKNHYYSFNDAENRGFNYDNEGASGVNSIAAGINAAATGEAAVATGVNAEANGDHSISLGYGTTVNGARSAAIGDPTVVNGDDSYSLGNENRIDSNKVFVMGNNVTVGAGLDGSVVLGDGSSVNAAVATSGITLNGTDYLFAGVAPTSSVSVGSLGAERTITNVAAGRLSGISTDAVNGSQLFATNQAIDGLQTGSVLYDTHVDRTTNHNSVTLGGDTYNSVTKTGGTRITNVANGVAPSDAVNFSQLTETNNSITNLGDNITNLGDDITTIYGRGIKYFHANSTGALASATGQDAVAIGMGAVASHSNSVALGAGSQTAAAVGTAGATIGGNDYLFAGTAPTSTVSVGDVGAERTLTHVAAGRLSGNSTDAVNGSQLFATNSQVDINTTDISNLGDDITNLGDEVTNIFGQGIKYFHANSTGALASATGQDAVAIGMGALASANNSVALGAGSLADGSTLSHQAYLVGGTATGEVNVGNRRITGLSAGAEDADAVNVAQLREVTAGSVADAVMYDSSAHNRVTLGGSRATAPVALTNVAAGALTSTSTDAVNGAQLKSTNDQVDINTTNIVNHTVDIRGLKQDALLWDTSLGAFSANHTGSGPNKITNVAKGTLSETSTDAVNGAQLYAVNNNVTNLENVINNLRPTDVKYLKVNSSSTASVATGSEAIAIGPDAVASGNSSIASGKGAQSSGLSSIAMGTEANASADGSIATGNHAKASGLDSVAIGNSANATASNAVALGANSVADRADSVSVGAAGKERQIVNVAAGTRDTDAVNLAQLNKVTGDITNIDNTVNNISSGTDGMFQVNNTDGLPKPVVEGKNALAGGAGSAASGDNSMAVGTSAKSSGVDSVALGNSSYATAKNSVALGANSVADRENTISVGSVGSERQIANVAAGTQGTDAVNVTQLNSSISNANNYTDNKFSSLKNMIDDNKDKMSAGVAGAMAMASLPQPYSPGASMVSMGGATFQNQSSVALGVSTISDNGKWVTKFSGSTNTQNDLGVSVGVGYQW
ncbi:autotransporter adhesin, partial [Buttiauxella sp. BIGb0552]|uniref:YadA-like family protein n=1 Tax=Buttiauxella sp. BIGb0552 TaxID=2485120 RepID=UPI001064E5E2